MKTTNGSQKRAYVAPSLKNLGEVKELTKSLKGSQVADGAVSGDMTDIQE